MATFQKFGAWLRPRGAHIAALFFGVLAPLVLFGILAEDVLRQGRIAFDQPILLFLHGFSSPRLDMLALGFSLAGYVYGVYPLSILIGLSLWGYHRRREALFWALSLGGAGLLNLLGKQAFGRPRPALWPSPAHESSFSFPSGHAMGSMAFVAALTLLVWRTPWRWPTVALGGLFVLCVGLSRAYLGVHYPSDVLAGWAASLAWVLGLGFVGTRGPQENNGQSDG